MIRLREVGGQGFHEVRDEVFSGGEGARVLRVYEEVFGVFEKVGEGCGERCGFWAAFGRGEAGKGMVWCWCGEDLGTVTSVDAVIRHFCCWI